MVFHARSRYVASTLIAAIFLSLLLSRLSVPTFSADPTDPPIHIHLTWQNETNTTITVTWQTSTSTAGDTVKYDTVSRGGNPDLYSYSSTGTNHTYSDEYGPASGYIHDVELTGLTPNTIYYFICGGDTGSWSNERAFRTAPSTPSYTRFVAGGDSQDVYSPYLAAMLERMATYNPSFMINLGDHVANGEKQSEWDEYFSMLHQYLIGNNNLTIPLIPIFGNHDPGWLGKNSTKYFEQFALPQGGNEQWFSYDWGPDIHIIVLGSEDKKYPNSSVAQRDWLESDLINHSSSKFKIVCFHRPPFVASDHDEPYTPAITHWVPLFDKYHVDLVLNGHDHCYMRSKPVNWTASNTTAQNSYGQGTMYVVTGGLGNHYPHEPNRHWWTSYLSEGDINVPKYSTHFVLVDIYENDTLHLQAKDLYGVTFDEAWLVKGYSGPVALFTYRPRYLLVNDTVTFDASSSVSGNDTYFVPIVNYTWDFGDGNITTTSNPVITHEYALNNTYTVTLNITDSQGQWNTTSRTIKIGPLIHELAVTNVSIFRNVVASGYSTEIDVTAENRGTDTETFNVTVYYSNSSWHLIEKRTATVAREANITLTFTWTTTGISKGDYTIIANVSMIPGETNTTDNIFESGDAVKVTLVGDIDGDGYVYVLDLSLLGGSWRQRRGQPNYNPNADIDCDDYVYVLDLSLLGAHWRQRDP